jgi:flagellar basal-body rod protein FlgF
MLRSLYIAGTGMITQRSKMDVITNNIVNLETVGYKKDQMISRSFSDMLLERLNDPNIINRRTEVGPLNTGTHIDEIVTDLTEGPLEFTEENTDFAIEGDGYFSVLTPQGIRYTRSGNFQVDINGDLVTQEGYYVLGQDGGRLHIGTGDFAVSGNGTITADNRTVGTLRLVSFEDQTVLRKAGDNLYTTLNNAQPQASDATIKQGYLETSNVDMATEMVDMLATNRAYESSQRIVKMVDESLGKTVNEIARF